MPAYWRKLLVNEQINQVRAEVERTGLSKSDYAGTFDNLSKVVTIGNFLTAWNSYQQFITDELLRQLGIFSQLSSVNEPVVPVEDFGTLKGELLNFREEVLQNVTDDRLKAFVLKQIDIILRGIREYPIRGAAAIKDGDAAAFALAFSENELIKQHKGDQNLEKTGGFWIRFRQLMPRVVISIDPTKWLAGTDAQKMIEAGNDLVDKL